MQAFASGIAKAIDLLPLLIGGLVAKNAAIGFSIASSFGALTKGVILGGPFGVAATIAAIAAGATALYRLTPRAQTGTNKVLVVVI